MKLEDIDFDAIKLPNGHYAQFMRRRGVLLRDEGESVIATRDHDGEWRFSAPACAEFRTSRSMDEARRIHEDYESVVALEAFIKEKLGQS